MRTARQVIADDIATVLLLIFALACFLLGPVLDNGRPAPSAATCACAEPGPAGECPEVIR